MPGFLLNTASVVLCTYGGQAKPTVPNPRVKVMGQPITTLKAPYVVAGCVNHQSPEAPPTPQALAIASRNTYGTLR